ncbi:MAG: NifB/NifX family molybdenum-iron cluster-binding protein [Leptolyngbyaceae cyanobacterium]
MTEKLLAIAVAKDGNIAAHAGRALRWEIYTIPETAEASLAWTLDLTSIGSLHEWHVQQEGNRHPLHGVDIAIAASAGEGVRRRLQERNTELLTTAETNPAQAIAAYRAGNLAPGLPHEPQACHQH